MWLKKETIGLWLWIPEMYEFRESVAFFTIKNNVLDENKQLQHDGINKLNNVATVVIYENNADEELIHLFNRYITGHVDTTVMAPHIAEYDADPTIGDPLTTPVIGIFSFKRNRYSKPFTGAFELLEQIANNNRLNAPTPNATIPNAPQPFKFKLEWSILISPSIGIGGQYIDRAFAHNIGINTVTAPSLYFISKELIGDANNLTKKIEWGWPTTVLTERHKKKIFKFDGEPKFADFIFPNHINIVIVTGPPYSGKTILGRRIATYIGKCMVCKNELPRIQGKSLVHISHAPTATDKQKLIKWLIEYNKPYLAQNKSGDNKPTIPNLVWIEMDVSRQVVNFLRHLRVQISRQSCPVLQPYSYITDYYKIVEPLLDDHIPPAVTHINFPLVLKKIPELNYIF